MKDFSRFAQVMIDPVGEPACQNAYNYPVIAILSGGAVLAIVLGVLLIKNKNINKRVRALALVCIGLFVVLWLTGLILGKISLTEKTCAL